METGGDTSNVPSSGCDVVPPASEPPIQIQLQRAEDQRKVKEAHNREQAVNYTEKPARSDIDKCPVCCEDISSGRSSQTLSGVRYCVMCARVLPLEVHISSIIYRVDPWELRLIGHLVAAESYYISFRVNGVLKIFTIGSCRALSKAEAMRRARLIKARALGIELPEDDFALKRD